MGQVIDVVAELRRDNKNARDIDLKICGDAIRTYVEAAENVERNGAICAHPRTGSPIENPYLKIMASQAGLLSGMRLVNTDRVFKLLTEAQKAPQTLGETG